MARAQVSSADQRCISAFNSGVRKVAKTHGRTIAKCLRDFAAGRLASTTPEGCLIGDPAGKLSKTVDKAVALTTDKCAAGTPSFGVTPVANALVRAVLGQIDLAHSTFGSNLNTGLIANGTDASCQSRVGAALLKCSDRRMKEYLACQKTGLRNGSITDAASLEATCLGTGAQGQPDPKGRIARDCELKVSNQLGQRCSATDLTLAFAPCDASTPAGVTACLESASACHLCLVLNDVDGLNRECDLFDDGDGNNGSCGAECGDGVLQESESCDDGGIAPGDGCSDTCSVEGGYTCTGEPSVCTPNCGNGALDPGETCDDSDATSGDGCSNACTVENGYTCTGEPSVCVPNCGNGDLNEGEACDDGDGSSGDGCSSSCTIEPGYNCSGEPSVCTFVCGNGTFQAGETCDDNDATGGDGCSAVCQIETGWLCSGQPSLCTPKCGDGLLRGGETCDDGDVQSGDGCAFNCVSEPGFSCSGQPSNCVAVCGDGFIRGFENCDDLDNAGGDGCSANFCRQEAGYSCSGQPSVCILNCGDGNLDVPEQCDDGDAMSGDGCASNCFPEPGYACGGQPSICLPTCGNALLNLNEDCDDGNINNGDGCSASCDTEPGYLCTVPGSACSPYDLFIDSPAHGIFTTASSILITGHYTTLLPGQASITVNGVPASFVDPINRTYSHTVSLSAANVFNPVRVTLTNLLNGDDIHRRIVVIRGDSVADGAFSPQSVAMRLNDSGLDSVEPLVGSLAAGQLNLADVLPPGTVLADECFIDSFLGCLGSARVTIASPAPSFSHITLTVDSVPNAVFGDIDIFNIRVDVNIDGSGLVPDCGLRLTASALQLTGNYALEPDSVDASNVDVNLVTNPLGVQFTGFNHTFTSGLCDAPIIGDIIQAFLPDMEEFATNGIRDFLSDPDGGGPQDSPIADAIETVLAGISISGPVGEGVGLMFQSPLFAVTEDNVGITFGSNSRFLVSVGSGPGQCIPPPGAPDFTRSYSPVASFPAFGANTPVGGLPYGLGIAISSSGFNQLLRGQTECGLMMTSLTSIDLDGPGGTPPLPVTSTLLSLIVPEFSQLPPGTPLRIDVAPTLAPIVTGNAGPAGELADLRIAHVALRIVEPGPETVWLGGALDARLGLNLTFDGSGLAITLTPPALSDLTVAILENPLGADENQVEVVLPALVQPLIPSLAGALSGFPLPQFFGLSLDGVEVSRTGQFLSLYANLVPSP